MKLSVDRYLDSRNVYVRITDVDDGTPEYMKITLSRLNDGAWRVRGITLGEVYWRPRTRLAQNPGLRSSWPAEVPGWAVDYAETIRRTLAADMLAMWEVG